MQPNSELNADSLEDAIDEALEGNPRAEQWQSMIAALRTRRERLQRDLELSDDNAEREEFEEKLREVEQQIQVLDEEASITSFVEGTVKFSYQVHRLTEG